MGLKSCVLARHGKTEKAIKVSIYTETDSVIKGHLKSNVTQSPNQSETRMGDKQRIANNSRLI